nr:hypothetical transcript [Hymenolepis microstoma]
MSRCRYCVPQEDELRCILLQFGVYDFKKANGKRGRGQLGHTDEDGRFKGSFTATRELNHKLRFRLKTHCLYSPGGFIRASKSYVGDVQSDVDD